MQDTRQQILEVLKRRGEVTVQELSQELGLTSVTVRHHLDILRSEGFITDPEIKRSNRPGRPRYVYHLTSTAADLFPNNYSGLAAALLDALRVNLTPEQENTILLQAAHTLAAGAENLPADPDERMVAVLNSLKQLGFVARTEKSGPGCYLLHVSNCPYQFVARTRPQTCCIDEFMIQQLTGGQLTRLSGRASEDAVCSYQILWSADENVNRER